MRPLEASVKADATRCKSGMTTVFGASERQGGFNLRLVDKLNQTLQVPKKKNALSCTP